MKFKLCVWLIVCASNFAIHATLRPPDTPRNYDILNVSLVDQVGRLQEKVDMVPVPDQAPPEEPPTPTQLEQERYAVPEYKQPLQFK